MGIMLTETMNCGVKLCEYTMKVAAVVFPHYTCKIRDGTELEMETQSDTRHNLKTTPPPTPTVSSLHCESCRLLVIYYKKIKK